MSDGARCLVALAVVLTVAAGACGRRTSRTEPSASASATIAIPSPDAAASGTPSDGGAQRVKPAAPDDEEPETLAAQRERLFRRMREELDWSDEVLGKVRAIFESSPFMSQGNPTITKHPMKRSDCWGIRERAGLVDDKALDASSRNQAICGARYMAPVGKNAEAGFQPEICVDQFEFPGIPCEYPVTFVSAKQAVELCAAVGKRMCDAHEWEGACAGALKPVEQEYLFERPRRVEMEFFKNKEREKVWAYGAEKDHSKCATGSRKSPKCGGGGWETCGTNTYPAGSFPLCVSAFGVFDLHGNAAEHMNLPMKPEELMSRGGSGMTEMKGSWFIFARDEAHEDDCRWRAPSWHESKVMHGNSHLNYHLGFRCCKSLDGKGPADAAVPTDAAAQGGEPLQQ